MHNARYNTPSYSPRLAPALGCAGMPVRPPIKTPGNQADRCYPSLAFPLFPISPVLVFSIPFLLLFPAVRSLIQRFTFQLMLDGPLLEKGESWFYKSVVHPAPAHLPQTIPLGNLHHMSTQGQVQQGPPLWRDKGYPALCSYLASADNLVVLRRFNKVQMRVLLSMQDAIAVKEKRLLELDEESRTGPPAGRNLGTFRDDRTRERTRILDQLRDELQQYSEYTHDSF